MDIGCQENPLLREKLGKIQAEEGDVEYLSGEIILTLGLPDSYMVRVIGKELSLINSYFKFPLILYKRERKYVLITLEHLSKGTVYKGEIKCLKS